MTEETTVFEKEKTSPSKIFNTSVRGWIALALALCLCLCILLIVFGAFMGIEVGDRISDPLITLFSTGFGSAVTQYFHQRSREGQS